MIPAQPRPALGLIIATQSLLAALILAGIGAIALLPRFSADIATSLPEYADLRTPLLAIAVAITLLALLVLALASLLVHRIHRGTILSRSSLLWVDGIIVASVCGILLVVVAFVVISNGQAGSPFLALTQALACLGLAALGGVMLVLRSLLRHAIFIRDELDEVV